MTLKNAIVFVAGASGLIGRAVCENLRSKGATVLPVDVSFPSEQMNSSAIIADICQAAEYSKLETAFESHRGSGKNFAFVNVAYPRTKNWGTLAFENVTFEDLSENLSLQLGGAFLFSQFAVKMLKRVGGGAIVNFGSIYGLTGPDLSIYEGTKMNNPSPYALIKGGTMALTRYIATTYGKDQIRSNAVCPGGVFDHQPASFVESYCKKTPLGRMAEPADVAGLVSFLVSDEARYITGTVIPVDGGWTAW